MEKIDFNNLDIAISYHDRKFDCDATFTVESARKSPFTKEQEEMLNEFAMTLGAIKSVTIKFKDNG